jgi:hypothetical protein
VHNLRNKQEMSKPIVFSTVQPNWVLLPDPHTRPLLATPSNLMLADLPRYDDKTLFYDVWLHEGELWLMGPPLLDLETIPFHVLCNGQEVSLVQERVVAESERLLIWHGPVEANQAQVQILFGEARIDLQLESISSENRRRRILTTLQKDNRVEWIADWIAWYAHHYAIDAVVLYDNNSADQPRLLQRIAQALQPRLRPSTLSEIILVPWNAPYGLIVNHSHANFFAQHGSLNHCPRRFCRPGDQVLNFDIDELLFCQPSLLDSLRECRLLKFDSYWVPIPQEFEPGKPYSFASFTRRERKPRGTCHKYALQWTGAEQLCVHYVIDVEAEPLLLEQGYYLHYRAISTFWKEAVMRNGSARVEALQRRAPVSAWHLVNI